MCALKLKWAERAKHVLPRRDFPPLSTGPSLKTERFQRGRSCGTGGIPFGAPLRGSTDTSRLSAGGPGAGAPHGNLAGPRQPLVPFPCGKGTRASADARNSLKPPPHPPSVRRLSMIPNKYPCPLCSIPNEKLPPFQRELLLLLQPYLRQYRTIRWQRRRCLFCHLLLAEISIYLQ